MIMDLSIIIPVYNGAETIGRCLDSIYSQGLDENKYEVICVDDCSPDPSSVAAIENYKYQNCHPSNLILIKHEVNKRQGGARNTGVKAAKGEWIQFIDCDDFLLPNSLKRVLQVATSHQELDLVTFDFIIRTKDKVILRDFRKKNKSQVMSGQEYHICQSCLSQVCEGMFKKKCFFSNNIWFIENKRFEDLDFIIRFVIAARKVLFTPIDVYCYFKHPGSTMDYGYDKVRIRELFMMFNRVAVFATGLMDNYKYKKNAELMLDMVHTSYMTFTKKDLWKVPFRERLLILREISIPFRKNGFCPSYIYRYPFVACAILCFLNQPILNFLIKLKTIVKRLKI